MAKAAKTTNSETPEDQDVSAAKAPRVTKQQIMIDMLSRPEGAALRPRDRDQRASHCSETRLAQSPSQRFRGLSRKAE